MESNLRINWQHLMSSAALMGTLAACRGTAHVGNGMNLSSEASEYSPTIRLAVRMPVLTDLVVTGSPAVVLRVDSGYVTAHRGAAPSALIAMQDLHISAILVAFPTGDAERGKGQHPWSEVARSGPQHLADSLSYAERARLTPMTFVIPLPHGRLSGANGIAFEITGISMSSPVRLATGELRPSRSMGEGSIRVFACSVFRLDGAIDRAREQRLNKWYLQLC